MEIVRYVNGEKVTAERLKSLAGTNRPLEEAVRQIRRRVRQEKPRRDNAP